MHLLELNLFSGFQLLNQRGETLSGMSRKAKALLAWLALNPNQEYPREKLAGILWPDSSEAQARHSLRQALSSLRKILPADSSFLQATKDWIMLDSNQIQLDVQRFDKALKIADAESLDEAIQLYQGALLEGCNPKSDSFDDWLFNYRNNYQELAISAINKRLAMLLDTDFSKDSDYEMVIHYANQLIKIDELQEPAYQALMLAYNK
jgi:DNA-binding SARP family transcriptional activator